MENKREKLIAADLCRLFKNKIKKIIEEYNGNIWEILAEVEEKYSGDGFVCIRKIVNEEIISFSELSYSTPGNKEIKLVMSGIITEYGVLVDPEVLLLMKDKEYSINIKDEDIRQ